MAVERIIMAEGGSSPESGRQEASQVSGEPNVIIAPESTGTQKLGKIDVLVKPPHKELMELSIKERIKSILRLPEEKRQEAIARLIPEIKGGAVDSLEYEASPERAREITENIIKQEALLYAGEYGLVTWEELNRAYREQRIHIEALRLVKTKVKPSEAEKQPEPVRQEIMKVDPAQLQETDGTDFTPPTKWLAFYKDGKITDSNRDQFMKQVRVYFSEAKIVGLLKDLDVALSSIYNTDVKRAINRKQTSAEVRPIIGEKLKSALNSVEDVYQDRLWTDPEIRKLDQVWQLYAQFALERFVVVIDKRDLQRLSIGNEFLLELAEDESAPQETFWRNIQGYYLEVYAQTEEEFLIAADTYTSRLESITAAPEKIRQDTTQFIDVIMRSDGAKKMTDKFLTALILGIEARVGAFGADQSNELYNGEYYKAYMDYIEKDAKGPARWLELAKMLNGQVAAALWLLDKDPRWEVLFSLYGSRGQLADASMAQRNREDGHGLHYQVKDMLVEELLGATIKNKKGDIKLLTKFMPDRVFTSLFEGLYDYRKLLRQGRIDKNRSIDDVLKDRYNELAAKDENDLTVAELRFKRLTGIREVIKEKLKDIQGKIRNGEIELKADDTATDLAIDTLSKSDKNFYKIELERARKAVEIALQIYGSFGENSKRYGGVFKTDRKVDAQGREFQYFVPVHMAEKFVQFAETWTKIKYADSPAKDQVTTVKEARDRAIAELKKNGFEAKLYLDDQGNPMRLKRPEEDLTKEDELARDANGNVIVEEVPVNFYIATHHPYADWTGHTYWSYQEEDRHLVLSPTSFAQARKIREGQLRPEDADMWAVQLLILDPTLKRVRKFPKNFEDRERKLSMAAVEDSYQSHWRIGRELYRAFWPKYGTLAKDINIYYGLQDFGGYRKMNEHIRARIAEDPERFARRGRRLLPDLHNPISPFSEYLGQGTMGAIGIIRMLDAPIYRGVGAFALDKFAAQAEVAGKIYGALLGGRDREGMYDEGLLLKPTNNSDKLINVIGKVPTEAKIQWQSAASQNEFCYAVIESLGRLKRYEQLLVVMETDIRNASGAQWLEDVDILRDNGQLNPDFARRLNALPDISKGKLTKDDLATFIQEAEAIEEISGEEFNSLFNTGDKERPEERPGIDEGRISTNTGSGRHSAKLFHETFGRFLIDLEKRGGVDLYPGEKWTYSHINDKIVILDKNDRKKYIPTNRTIWDFVFEKFVPT